MKKGFTLIELLIVMAISGIVAGAIFTAFQSQQRSYAVQEDVSVMQQNLRAGMDILIREIRMAGYDPTEKSNAQIEYAEPDLISFTTDDNGDGDLNDANEHIAFDYYNTSTLGRTTSSSTITVSEKPAAGSGHFEATFPSHQPLVENIEAFGLAYAFDADGDGNIDTYTDTSGVSQIIWAVDSNGDNRLDINLDTTKDGNIDAADGPGIGNNGLIGGVALATPVSVSDIRAVRIWMLARAGHMDSKYLNTNTYVVGNKIITPNTDADPNNDNLRMRLLSSIVKFRNLGL